MKEIRRLDEELEGINLLIGSEVEILPHGRVDFEDSLLPELDFVIASVHSNLTGSRKRITTCLMKVMDNPYVTCLGHPTGRIYGYREPMDLDMTAIIAHAAQTQTALEINATPFRLDLKDTHARMAVEAGVKLSINTDAHHTSSFWLITYGVATAARAWVTKEDVINCLPLPQLKQWITKKRNA